MLDFLIRLINFFWNMFISSKNSELDPWKHSRTIGHASQFFIQSSVNYLKAYNLLWSDCGLFGQERSLMKGR